MTTARGRDGRTRRRLLEAATRLFAERGFKHVTVRTICQEARANVAAVNYHFRDKLGLYREVFEEAASASAGLTSDAMAAGAGQPAEERLRAYVRVHCEYLFEHGPTVRLQQLVHRELQDPTKMLASLVERVWRPRFDYLSAIVAERLELPIDDPRVLRSAVSIHVQTMMARSGQPLERLGLKVRRAFAPAEVVDHITAFSLAGLEAYRPIAPHRL